MARWRAANPEKIAAINARYRAKHREQIAEKAARYRAINQEVLRAKKAAWYQANKERVKARHQARAEEIAAYQREWRAKNPMYHREHEEANRERRAEQHAAWAKANPDKRAIVKHRRRVRVRGNGSFLRTPRDRVRRLARQRGCCFYCGDRLAPGRGTQEDHVIPVARGGTDGVGNVVYACEWCNVSKGSKTIMEWRRVRPALGRNSLRGSVGGIAPAGHPGVR